MIRLLRRSPITRPHPVRVHRWPSILAYMQARHPQLSHSRPSGPPPCSADYPAAGSLDPLPAGGGDFLEGGKAALEADHGVND